MFSQRWARDSFQPTMSLIWTPRWHKSMRSQHWSMPRQGWHVWRLPAWNESWCQWCCDHWLVLSLVRRSIGCVQHYHHRFWHLIRGRDEGDRKRESTLSKWVLFGPKNTGHPFDTMLRQTWIIRDGTLREIHLINMILNWYIPSCAQRLLAVETNPTCIQYNRWIRA